MKPFSHHLRLAQPSDFEQWLGLWEAYQRFYEVEITKRVSETTWHRFHDAQEPMHCAVVEQIEAESNKAPRLVAMVHYIFHRSCWTAGDYCYLQDLFTHPDLRGQGLGRMLIEHVYAEAAKRGASRVWWLTHEHNRQAMYLYERIADRSGFIQYRKLL